VQVLLGMEPEPVLEIDERSAQKHPSQDQDRSSNEKTKRVGKEREDNRNHICRA
jgi:hypothetical protein